MFSTKQGAVSARAVAMLCAAVLPACHRVNETAGPSESVPIGSIATVSVNTKAAFLNLPNRWDPKETTVIGNGAIVLNEASHWTLTLSSDSSSPQTYGFTTGNDSLSKTITVNDNTRVVTFSANVSKESRMEPQAVARNLIISMTDATGRLTVATLHADDNGKTKVSFETRPGFLPEKPVVPNGTMQE